MTGDSRAIRQQARGYFESNGLGPDEQTRICLYLQGLKGINAAILAKVEFQPFEWLPYKFLHTQYFRELELISLLGKSTAWSRDPFVYLDATNLNLSLWRELKTARYMQGFLQADRVFFEYLALGHAFMSEVRMLPLLPAQLTWDTPFLYAVQAVEDENDKQIHTQSRLLKELDVGLSEPEREQIISEKRDGVGRLFDRLLTEMARAA